MIKARIIIVSSNFNLVNLENIVPMFFIAAQLSPELQFSIYYKVNAIANLENVLRG